MGTQMMRLPSAGGLLLLAIAGLVPGVEAEAHDLSQSSADPSACWDCCDQWADASKNPACLESYMACYEGSETKAAFIKCVEQDAANSVSLNLSADEQKMLTDPTQTKMLEMFKAALVEMNGYFTKEHIIKYTDGTSEDGSALPAFANSLAW